MTEYLVEADTREFIKRLPDLTVIPPSSHLVFLAIRSKKAKDVLGRKLKDMEGHSVKDRIIERKIIKPQTNWRERYFNAIYNLAVLQHHGQYSFGDQLKIPEVTGIYATLSPRNVVAAIEEMLKEDIGLFVLHNEDAFAQLIKQDSSYFRKLHATKLRVTNFETVDIDNRDVEVFKEMRDITSVLKRFMTIESSGGWHIVLDLAKPSDAIEWYGEKKLKYQVRLKWANKGVEIQHDSQEPVPGALYNRKGEPGFHVKLLE